MNVEPDDIFIEVDDTNHKEEVRSNEHFLVGSEIERPRHKLFNYAIENLNAAIVDVKLDPFFNNIKCAAKVNIVISPPSFSKSLSAPNLF